MKERWSVRKPTLVPVISERFEGVMIERKVECPKANISSSNL